MSRKSVVKIVCLSVIGLPTLITATHIVAVPSWVTLLIAFAAMVAGLVMGETEPGYGKPES